MEKKVWQKEDWKRLFLQVETQPIHTGWVKAHSSGQAFQDNLKVFQPIKVKLPQTGIVPMINGHSRTISLGGHRLYGHKHRISSWIIPTF